MTGSNAVIWHGKIAWGFGSVKKVLRLFGKHTLFFSQEDEMTCIQTPCYPLRGRKGGKKKKRQRQVESQVML